jgi:hypothetical protein
MLVNKEAVAKTLTASNYVDVITGTTSTTIPAKGVVELQSDGSVWRQTGGYAQSGAKATVYATGSLTLQTNPSISVPLAPLSNEVLDIGNNFNNTTGVFTAPRTGNYQISGFLGMNSRPNTQTIHFISLVNTAGSITYPGTTGTGHVIEQYVIPVNYIQGTIFNRVVYMTAGSSVSLIYYQVLPSLTWDTGNSANVSLQLNIAEL